MNKFYTILPVFLALFISACAEEKKPVAATAAAEVPLSTHLVEAQLVRSWARSADSAKLVITGAGEFTLNVPSSVCNVTGTIASIDEYPQAQCLAGSATCGVIHLAIAPTTDCHGFTAGTPGVCSYQTRGYDLTVNCGSQTSDTQTFQWE